MEAAKYIEIVSAKKGANLSATWERPVKVKKAFQGVDLVKVTKAVVRGGVDYDNLKTVKEGRENGEKPAENAGLPWGEWAAFPFHITHKGNDYLRLYPASGIEFIPKTTFLLDGVEVDKNEIRSMCLASEFSKDDKPVECFTIKAETLTSIDGWTIEKE